MRFESLWHEVSDRNSTVAAPLEKNNAERRWGHIEDLNEVVTVVYIDTLY